MWDVQRPGENRKSWTSSSSNSPNRLQACCENDHDHDRARDDVRGRVHAHDHDHENVHESGHDRDDDDLEKGGKEGAQLNKSSKFSSLRSRF